MAFFYREKMIRNTTKDPKRQCLITKKQLLENEKWGPPKVHSQSHHFLKIYKYYSFQPKNNNTVINVKDDVDTVPKEDEEDSSVALAVSDPTNY